MSLEGFHGAVTAEPADVDAHVGAAGGEGGVVLPVHVQGGGCGRDTAGRRHGLAVHQAPGWFTTTKGTVRRPHLGPGWCSSVDGAVDCEPKGHRFDSPSGHMPGSRARSPVGGAPEATTH